MVGGTYEYMAPESIKNKLQGPEVDLWALGVLLYELFHNREPYKGKSTREVLKSVLSTELQFSFNMSREAIDLIRKLLVVEPQRRIKMDKVLQHPFFAKNGIITHKSSSTSSPVSQNSVISKRASVNKTKLLRSLSLNVMDEQLQNRENKLQEKLLQ